MVRQIRRVMQRRSFRSRRRFGRQSNLKGNQRLSRGVVRGPSRRGPIIRQIRSLQSYVKGLRPEMKYTDTDIAATNVTTSGAVVHISGVAQGDTIATRTGDQINIKSIDVRGRIVSPTSIATPSGFFYRVAVIVDKQQVADTAPTAGAVFSPNDVVSMMPNVANLDRFRILYLSQIFDARRMVNDSDNATSVPTQGNIFSFSWTGDIKVRYNGTASTDIQKNGIFVVYMSNDTGDTIDFAGISRIGYTDT